MSTGAVGDDSSSCLSNLVTFEAREAGNEKEDIVDPGWDGSDIQEDSRGLTGGMGSVVS
jgi:hypothetical protein